MSEDIEVIDLEQIRVVGNVVAVGACAYLVAGRHPFRLMPSPGNDEVWFFHVPASVANEIRAVVSLAEGHTPFQRCDFCSLGVHASATGEGRCSCCGASIPT